MNNDLLTLPSHKDYSFTQVLNTLQQAESPAPDSRGFFAPIVFNNRVVGNDKILEKSGKVASRLVAVFKYLVASLNRRQILNESTRRPIMAASDQDASASNNPISNAIPQELIVIIGLGNVDITEFHGTKAMLENEGIIPKNLEWPKGYDNVYWKDDRFTYWLRRIRPNGAKGPRKQWENVDWFCLRWSLIDANLADLAIARKVKELKATVYRYSQEGIAVWKRYWKAEGDKQFQAFKAKIPCLTRPVRGRKAARSNSAGSDNAKNPRD